MGEAIVVKITQTEAFQSNSHAVEGQTFWGKALGLDNGLYN